MLNVAYRRWWSEVLRYGTEAALDDLLTTREVADWLGVAHRTLYQWRQRRTGPRSIKVGHDLRYRRVDVELWLAERTA